MEIRVVCVLRMHRTNYQMELQGIYGKLRTEIDTAFETQARLEDNKEDVSGAMSTCKESMWSQLKA